MRVTNYERRRIGVIFSSILPAAGDTSFPDATALPLDRFIDDFFAHTPPGSSVGVRLAALIICLASWLLAGRSFLRSTRAQQQALLARMASSRVYIVRELPTLMKLTAFMAWGGDPRVHAHVHVPLHDGRPAAWLESAPSTAEQR